MRPLLADDDPSLMSFDFSRAHATALIPCAVGMGVAVSTTLRRLVITDSSKNALCVFVVRPDGTFPFLGSSQGVLTLDLSGGDGGMCFTVANPPTLLLPEPALNRVQEINVQLLSCVGALGDPGQMEGPRCTAACASFLAVSAWRTRTGHTPHLVHLFSAGPHRTHVRTLAGDGQLSMPLGLRLTQDGAHVAVVDPGNGRVCLLSTADGALVGTPVTDRAGLTDVQQCRGGWMVTRLLAGSVELHLDGVAGPAAKLKPLAGPYALALVPGLGMVVRELNQVQVLSNSPPSDAAVAAARVVGEAGVVKVH